MWDIEEIPDKDFVYRRIPTGHLIGDKPRRFPSPSHFKFIGDGLSVNWDKYISVNENIILIGITYKKDMDEFMDYTPYHIFKFNVGKVKLIAEEIEIKHNPVFHKEIPSPPGCPNNKAHSLVIYSDDEEIRLKLSEYCSSEKDAKCDCNVKLLKNEIEELRKRLNETKYHKDWK